MNNFLYQFFNNETRYNTSQKKQISFDKDKTWPESWEKIDYKKYTIFHPVTLPLIKGEVWNYLQKRKSSNVDLSKNEINLQNLSYILKCAYGLQFSHNEKTTRKENRTTPSAGERFPMEVYVFIFKPSCGLKTGVYHYSVLDHALEPVLQEEFSAETILSFSSEVSVQNSNGFICLTSVFYRVMEKYEDRGYRYILLEAGHIGQNILIASTEIGISMIPIGGSNEKQMEDYIGLASSHEKVIYTLFF